MDGMQTYPNPVTSVLVVQSDPSNPVDTHIITSSLPTCGLVGWWVGGLAGDQTGWPFFFLSLQHYSLLTLGLGQNKEGEGQRPPPCLWWAPCDTHQPHLLFFFFFLFFSSARLRCLAACTCRHGTTKSDIWLDEGRPLSKRLAHTFREWMVLGIEAHWLAYKLQNTMLEGPALLFRRCKQARLMLDAVVRLHSSFLFLFLFLSFSCLDCLFPCPRGFPSFFFCFAFGSFPWKGESSHGVHSWAGFTWPELN